MARTRTPAHPCRENADTLRPGRSVALTPPRRPSLTSGRARTVGELALRLLLADGLLPPALAALIGPTLVDPAPDCIATAPDDGPTVHDPAHVPR